MHGDALRGLGHNDRFHRRSDRAPAVLFGDSVPFNDVALAWTKGVVAEVVLEGGFKAGGLGCGGSRLGGHPSVVSR